MTRIPGNQRLLASVFDRLIEIKPNEEATPQNPQSLSLSELQSNVFRDLASMLNSRQGLAEPLEEGSEVRQSVIAFGLPDISNVNPDSLEQQATIRAAVEESIRLFEPRLSNIVVTTQGASQSDRSLRLTVRANLKIEPNPVPVEFDTVIESGTGEWKVKKT
ncbi:type VI secretion system baseplate subunit TssE [Anatilimnocola floriformis]|uniref:type VI secretion system baseplate subunit TssE n=1 Tax=Anatilimnocola floriformis TaxID=2948575 RepID=UPI0020C20E8D|nr:type VI secretion system baseplate subunit TssE [Anatilimnocola floriformis]